MINWRVSFASQHEVRLYFIGTHNSSEPENKSNMVAYLHSFGCMHSGRDYCKDSEPRTYAEQTIFLPGYLVLCYLEGVKAKLTSVPRELSRGA